MSNIKGMGGVQHLKHWETDTNQSEPLTVHIYVVNVPITAYLSELNESGYFKSVKMLYFFTSFSATRPKIILLVASFPS